MPLPACCFGCPGDRRWREIEGRHAIAGAGDQRRIVAEPAADIDGQPAAAWMGVEKIGELPARRLVRPGDAGDIALGVAIDLLEPDEGFRWIVAHAFFTQRPLWSCCQ